MNFANSLFDGLAGELFGEAGESDADYGDVMAFLAVLDAAEGPPEEPDPEDEARGKPDDAAGEVPDDDAGGNDGPFGVDDVLHLEGGGGDIGPEAPGAEVSPPRDDLDLECERLQLRAEGVWPRQLWHVDSEAPLGKVYKIWGRSYKAVCKRHPRCDLLVNVSWFAEGGESAALLLLYRWLAEAPSTTENQHWASRCHILREVQLGR